jgi:hypothetical protein
VAALQPHRVSHLLSISGLRDVVRHGIRRRVYWCWRRSHR